MTVTEKSSFLKVALWNPIRSILSAVGVVLSDFCAPSLTSEGSSTATLQHRLAKSCGKPGTGTVLNHSLKRLSMGRANFSGKAKSFKHCSSSDSSLTSFRSSAFAASSSLVSRVCSTAVLRASLKFLTIFLRYYFSACFSFSEELSSIARRFFLLRFSS